MRLRFEREVLGSRTDVQALARQALATVFWRFPELCESYQVPSCRSASITQSVVGGKNKEYLEFRSH